MLDRMESHHACDVLRLRAGARVEVFDGKGRRAAGTLQGASRSEAVVRIEHREVSGAPHCRLTLVAALPKGKLLEWIIEKGTELGVSRFCPVVTDRSIARVEAAEGEKKREKWERVALEACKQSGQDWLPEVCLPVPLSHFLKGGMDFSQGAVVASLRAGASRLRKLIPDFEGLGHVTLFVGPEGDFTPGEYDAMVALGVREATLGARVLRLETAALTLVSVVGDALGI